MRPGAGGQLLDPHIEGQEGGLGRGPQATATNCKVPIWIPAQLHFIQPMHVGANLSDFHHVGGAVPNEQIHHGVVEFPILREQTASSQISGVAYPQITIYGCWRRIISPSVCGHGRMPGRGRGRGDGEQDEYRVGRYSGAYLQETAEVRGQAQRYCCPYSLLQASNTD